MSATKLEHKAAVAALCACGLDVSPCSAVELSEDDPWVDWLTNAFWSSEFAVQTDWRNPISEVIQAFHGPLARCGVTLSLGENDDLLEIKIEWENRATHFVLPESNNEDSDMHKSVFALDSMLPNAAKIHSLKVLDDSDGYGYVVLPSQKWRELKSILGVKFSKCFARHRPGPRRLVKERISKGSANKTVDWPKVFEWGLGKPSPLISPARARATLELVNQIDPRFPTTVIRKEATNTNAYHNQLFDAWSAFVGVSQVRMHDPRVPIMLNPAQVWGQFYFHLQTQLWLCVWNREHERFPTCAYKTAYAALLGAEWELLVRRVCPPCAIEGTCLRYFEEGFLGLGTLVWAYFIFSALECLHEAQLVGKLLLRQDVRRVERSKGYKRQDAYFDLALLLHAGQRGPNLGEIAPIVRLMDSETWSMKAAVLDAVQCHAEKRGEQFVHGSDRWTWPAEIYAIARRTEQTDYLPSDNPFLNHLCGRSDVDFSDSELAVMSNMHNRIAGLDATRLLPEITDFSADFPILVTEVRKHVSKEGVHVIKGFTRLRTDGGPEHRCWSICKTGTVPKVGENWEFRMKTSHINDVIEEVEDLGPVIYRTRTLEGPRLKPI